MFQIPAAAIIDSWGKVGMLACTILASAYYLGRAVGRIESEAKLTRIDLAMLFNHFGLQQPSRILAREQGSSNGKLSMFKGR